MKLSEIKIQKFRKLKDVKIILGDATFLIGANNAGKSSTLVTFVIGLSVPYHAAIIAHERMSAFAIPASWRLFASWR
mgnify:CR=1 FL=1